MAYAVGIEEEAKEKAVKPKPVQVNLEGKEVDREEYRCFFCSQEVIPELARIRREVLGHVVCNDCVLKIIQVISTAGARTL